MIPEIEVEKLEFFDEAVYKSLRLLFTVNETLELLSTFNISSYLSTRAK